MHVLSLLPLFVAMVTSAVSPPPFDPTTCGKEKTCVLKPAGCQTDCDFGMSFKPGKAKSDLDIEMFYKTNSDHSYTAIAFTDVCGKKCMANTYVSECSTLIGQKLSAKLSYNDDVPTNTRIDNAEDLASVLLKNDSYSSADGMVYCRFTQTVVGSRALLNGKPNTEKVFELDDKKKYTVLMAVGETSATGLTHHKSMIISDRFYDLFGAPSGSNTAAPAPSTTAIPSTTTTAASSSTSFLLSFGFATAALLLRR